MDIRKPIRKVGIEIKSKKEMITPSTPSSLDELFIWGLHDAAISPFTNPYLVLCSTFIIRDLFTQY